MEQFWGHTRQENIYTDARKVFAHAKDIAQNETVATKTVL